MTQEELIGKVLEYNPAADTALIGKAYEFSERMHEGQKRKSGEPYFIHPVAVAGILADMRLDVPTLATGLLHDTVEDTLMTLDDVRAEFGEEVAALVDGVTKIGKLEAESLETVEAESIRKMLIASAKDIRVLLVKLADRAHNLRTVRHLSEERQRRMAGETLEIFAPVAERLGMYWLKAEFERVCFRTLWPEKAQEIREKLNLHKLEREGYIDEIKTLMARRLSAAGIVAEVTGRTKSPYSIYKKMNQQGLSYDQIYDVVGFRVLVDATRECYDTLGVLHMSWRPVPGRFRDYVAMPKANRYSSLHTTLVGPYGETMEVQIRTHEMHREAENGVAAHWRYKAPHEANAEQSERFTWLRQVLEWQQKLDDPTEFLDVVKKDLFAEEVLVFTPRGDERVLRKGETVIDFAYRIHSEVGDRAAGARVNGKLVPLRYVLEAGDTVEVITTEDARPTREWLKFVAWPRARDYIRGALKREDRARAVALGRALLERDLARQQVDLPALHRTGRMTELLRHFEKEDEESLLEALGEGAISARAVVEHLYPGATAPVRAPRRNLRRVLGWLGRTRQETTVDGGIEQHMLRYGKCCLPLMGEDIVGFVTRGRGVTVHVRKCPRLKGLKPDRFVEVSWSPGMTTVHRVKLEVVSRDRPGVLADMSKAIAACGVNIDRAYVRTVAREAVNTFEMTLSTADELAQVEKSLLRVSGVKSVERVFGSAPSDQGPGSDSHSSNGGKGAPAESDDKASGPKSRRGLGRRR